MRYFEDGFENVDLITDLIGIERGWNAFTLQSSSTLQISDKGQIIARNEELRRLTGMQSRRQAEQAIKMLESLRNNLAHSQDILSSDWQTIVGLCQDIERVICGTEEVQSALDRVEQQVGVTDGRT